MSQIDVIDPDKLYSIHRYLSTSGREDFVCEDTREIAQTLFNSIFLESESGAPELLLAVMYDLMAYASSDGFKEGLDVGTSMVKRIGNRRLGI